MGKPGWSNVQSPAFEHIGRRSDTQGSETSQYLKEKKSTEIPLVAASERGEAKTSQFTGWGCGTLDGTVEVSRTSWKARAKRVIPL